MSAFDRKLTLKNVAQKYSNIGIKMSTDPHGELRRIKLKTLINHYEKGKIIIPDIQRVRDDEIINEMYITCKKNIHILINSTNPLQFCICGGIYALIDGQHRLETFKLLCEKNNCEYDEIYIPIHVINDISEIEIYKLYMNLNRNNSAIYNNVNCLDDMFRIKKYNCLKNMLYTKFPLSFIKSVNIYGINDFINTLSDMDYLDYYTTIESAYEYIIEINNNCYTMYNDTIVENITTIEYNIYETGFIGAIKRNNFMEILMLENPNYDDFKHVIYKRKKNH